MEAQINPPPTEPDYRSLVPDDYLEYAAHSPSRAAGDIVVLQPSKVYPVQLNDASYLGLAELPDVGMLAARPDDPAKRIWLTYYDGRASKPLSASFREALRLASVEK